MWEHINFYDKMAAKTAFQEHTRIPMLLPLRIAPMAMHERVALNVKVLRQCVIVMRGRFATWEFLALDLDIMVKVGCQHKRVS